MCRGWKGLGLACVAEGSSRAGGGHTSEMSAQALCVWGRGSKVFSWPTAPPKTAVPPRDGEQLSTAGAGQWQKILSCLFFSRSKQAHAAIN